MPEELDLILEGGVVVDGSGSPARRADVGVRGGTIAALGDLSSAPAPLRLDVSGAVVAPGFIDIHSHTDACYLVNPTAESKLTQGVTTEVGGNCGFSPAPLWGRQAQEEAACRLRELGIEERWSTLPEFFRVLEERGLAVNFACFAGHGNLRRAVLGYEARPPDASEMDRLCRLAEQAVEEGALGVSTGLIYPPGCYAETSEIAEVARAAARRGGLYATHLRDEGGALVEAVEEALEVGRRSGARVQISHHKACGPANWGKVETTLAMIDAANAEGVPAAADQYPYVATSTDLSAMLPRWAHEGGPAEALRRLSDPEERSRIRREMLAGGARHGAGFESIVITQTRPEANRWAEGRSLVEVARRWGVEPVDAALRLLEEAELAVGMCNFLMCEEDVERVMRHPRVCVGSDGIAKRADGPLGAGKPHPRAYGTFPRVLGRYSRERGVLTLEEAVRKMTGLTAELLGLVDRGRVREGLAADLVVFDPQSVRDRATFEEPHQAAEGIEHVLVNGVLALTHGRVTGALPGRVLRRSGSRVTA